MLNFGTYKANYIGRPVDQIGKMMQTLDANNRRIAATYNGLDQALSSIEVAPEDNDLHNAARQQIRSGIEEVIKAPDYSYAEGRLNKLVRDFTNNPALKSAASRYADYRAKQAKVEDLYYKQGAIDSDQYNFFHSQPFVKTAPDQHGVYVNSYDNFEMPVKRVDLDAELTNGLRMIESTKTADGIPGIVYLTKGELNDAAGLGQTLTDEEKVQPTEYIKYIKQGGVEYRTPDKIASVLNGLISSNPDTMAYLEQIARIKGVDTNSIIQSRIAPYIAAGTIYNDHSRYQVGNAPQAIGAYRKAAQTQQSNESSYNFEATPVIQGEDIDVEDQTSNGALTNAVNWVSQVFTGQDYIKNKVTVSDENPVKPAIDYASSIVTGKDFNDLSYEEQKANKSEIDRLAKEAYPKLLTTIRTARVVDSKQAEQAIKSTVGPKLEYDLKNEVLTKPPRPFYSFADGKIHPAEEWDQAVRDAVGKDKKASIVYMGKVDYSPLGYMTGKQEFSTNEVFNVGNATFVFPRGLGDNRLMYDLKAEVINKIQNNPQAGAIYANNPRYSIVYKLDKDGTYNLTHTQSKTSVKGIKPEDVMFAVPDILNAVSANNEKTYAQTFAENNE